MIAPGHIAVESNARKVQHPEGGVVAELKVREGARVKAGDLLVVLDDTVLRAELAIVSKALDELTAQEARLVAERDGADHVRFPARPDWNGRDPMPTPGIRSTASRSSSTAAGRRAKPRARNCPSRSRSSNSLIEGLSAQRAARDQELTLIAEELKGVRELLAKQLVPLTRVIALDRDRTRIEGERGKLFSDIATARGSIAEKKIQMVRLDDEFHSDVVRELADVRNKINESVERKVAATDRLSRIEIRAPVSGKVHQLNVFTIGGVIGSGEVAMLIVPEQDSWWSTRRSSRRRSRICRSARRRSCASRAFSDPNLKDASRRNHDDLAGSRHRPADRPPLLPRQAVGRARRPAQRARR